MYIPLGGSQEGKLKGIRNIFIVFIISGFWHGANWTFIFWGLFHAILFFPSFVFNTNRKYMTSIISENTILPTPKELFQVGITFILVTIGWVFFRSETIVDAFRYLYQMAFNLNEPIFSLHLLYVLTFIFFEKYILKNERDLSINPFIIFFLIGVIIGHFYFFSENNQFIYFDF